MSDKSTPMDADSSLDEIKAAHVLARQRVAEAGITDADWIMQQPMIERGKLPDFEYLRGPLPSEVFDLGRARRAHPLKNALDLPEQSDVINSDMANARRLASLHGDDLRFTPERGWMLFDGQRWIADEIGAVMAFAKKAAVAIFDEIKDSRQQKALFDWARRSQSAERLRAMVELTKSEPGIAARWTDFDREPYLLNCANGTLDLRTGQLRPHRRDDLLSRLCPVDWAPQADMEEWADFVFEVMDRDEDLYSYVKRAIGYTVTGDTSEQVLMFCHGRGSNGKSVLLETMQALLGEYGTTARTQTIMTRPDEGIGNDVAALRGARMVAVNETADGQRLNEPLIKDLTGGDTLNARFLYRESFNFKPVFKLWIRGNHKPVIRGTDTGIWRRIHLIPFSRTFEGADADKTLAETLRANLPGVLRWAVEGCREWQRVGLSPPDKVAAAVRDYRSEMDVLGAFLADRCEIGSNRQVTAKALYGSYRAWADQTGEQAVNQMRFSLALQERGMAKDRTRGGVIYVGLSLTQDPEREHL